MHNALMHCQLPLHCQLPSWFVELQCYYILSLLWGVPHMQPCCQSNLRLGFGDQLDCFKLNAWHLLYSWCLHRLEQAIAAPHWRPNQTVSTDYFLAKVSHRYRCVHLVILSMCWALLVLSETSVSNSWVPSNAAGGPLRLHSQSGPDKWHCTYWSG